MNIKHKNEEWINQTEIAYENWLMQIKKSGYRLHYASPKRSDIMILGLNPGGGIEEFESFEIQRIEEFDWADLSKNYTSEYADQEINAPYVRRIRKIFYYSFGKNGIELLKGVFGTNICFFRLKEIKPKNTLLKNGAILCWPILKDIIAIVQPKYIITLGEDVYEWFYEFIAKDNDIIIDEELNEAREKEIDIINRTSFHYVCIRRIFKRWLNLKDFEIKIISLPHPSRRLRENDWLVISKEMKKDINL